MTLWTAHQALEYTAGLGPAALLLSALWALLNCFAGYILFRVLLALWGALMGAVLAAALLAGLRENPGALDFIVAGGAGAVLLALAAWYLYRLVFAAVLALGVFQVAWAVSGGRPSAAGLTLTLVLAVLAVFLGLFRTRLLVIVYTAVAGGIGAAVAGVALLAGGTALQAAGAQPGEHVPVLVALAALMVVLPILGMVTQLGLARNVRSPLAPGGPARRPSSGIHPPFVRP